MEKSKMRIIYEYEFRHGITAVETDCNIKSVFDKYFTNKITMGLWFRRIYKGNFDFINETQGRLEFKAINDDLTAVIESHRSQGAAKL